MTYETVNEELVRRFPQLEPEYRDWVRLSGEQPPGPHLIFGTVFNPFLLETLRKGGDEEIVGPFEFLELLSSSEDERVQNIAAVTVIERLAGSPSHLSRALPMMGPKSRDLLEKLRSEGYA